MYRQMVHGMVMHYEHSGSMLHRSRENSSMFSDVSASQS